MFLVGGGILTHGIGPLHHAIEAVAHGAGSLGGLLSMVLDGLVGVVGGALVLGVVTLGQKALGKKAAH
jgi:predicted DNA repair protein MutK